MNRLRVEGLSAGYGAVAVLHGVSLEVRQGELVALLGMNGNGKSTLLNAIMGLVKARAGRILLDWDGETIDLTGRPTHEVVAAGLAFVPEGRRLVGVLTVAENLALAATTPRARDAAKRNLDLVYDTFPVLAERRNQRAGTMSGGQQQMLAIGRALMTAPRLMIVDEPSVGLAPIVVGQVFETVRKLQSEFDLGVLVAEQSFLGAIKGAAKVAVISHGSFARELTAGVDTIDEAELRRLMLGGH